MPETISSTKAIKEYFQADGGREVTFAELRALSAQEREDLGKMSAAALGKTWVPANA